MFKQLWRLGAANRWRTLLQVAFQWLGAMLVVTGLYLVAARYETGHWPAVTMAVFAAQLVASLGYILWGVPVLSHRWASSAGTELQQQYLDYYVNQVDQHQDETMKVIHQDLGTIKRTAVFYDTVIPTVLQLLLTGVVMTVTVVVVRPLTVLIPFAGLLGVVVGMGLLEGLADRTNNAYVKSFNQMGTRFLDDFAGMKTLVMYRQEQRYAQDFAHDSEDFRQKTMAVLRYQLQTLTIMDVFLYGALGWFVIVQGLAVRAGTLDLRAGVLTSALVATWLIDFRKFGYFIHVFMSMTPKMKRVFKLLATPRTENFATGTDTVHPREITLMGAVGYDAAAPVLTDVDVRLTPGTITGLVGASGGGKSTLARTLLKQIVPLTGTVSVDGIDLQTVQRTTWWRAAAYLGPETVLFSGTIADNLLLGAKPEVDWRARLDELGLCQFIGALPAGADTLIGDNGQLLSPGQRQQVAVARAILAEKDVYLFDEITANIDVENATVILHALQQLAQHAIVLLITHRLDDLQFIGDMYLIDAGTLHHGTPAELAVSEPELAAQLEEQAALLAEVHAS